MATPNSARSLAPHNRPDTDLDGDVDEYDSDEELEDTDLNLLNTDYAAQRDLSCYPTPYQHSGRHNPSIPPSLRQSGTYAKGTEAYLEKPSSDTDEWEDESPIQKDVFDKGSRYRSPEHNARAYQSYHQRRPLVDLIRNEWKNSPYTSSSSSSPNFHAYAVPSWLQILSAPRFRRYVLVAIGLFVLTWGNWHSWAGSQWEEHKLLGESLKERMKTGDGWFGENMRPEFLDLVHVMTLDQELVPKGADHRRLILVGDVHGCHDDLVHLLSEVQYEARTDHLIFVGDFIAKGPSSPAVVDLAMSAHASCVRGNHEDRVLLAYRDLFSHRLTHDQRHEKSQKSQKVPPPPMPGMPEDMLQDEPPPDDGTTFDSFEHGDAVNRKLAKSFTKKQIDWIAACPVILDVGQVNGIGSVHVVHAGLVPGVKLEKQDPVGVMHMRTIDLETFVPSGSPQGTAWYKLWNRYQTFKPSSKRSTVIYGHDSRRGLQLHDYSKGLDSGCVTGGRLTALIISGNFQEIQVRTVSVQCKDHRDPVKNGGEEMGEVE